MVLKKPSLAPRTSFLPGAAPLQRFVSSMRLNFKRERLRTLSCILHCSRNCIRLQNPSGFFTRARGQETCSYILEGDDKMSTPGSTSNPRSPSSHQQRQTNPHLPLRTFQNPPRNNRGVPGSCLTAHIPGTSNWHLLAAAPQLPLYFENK